MNERICLDCRSFRFDATIHPDHEARSETVSASGPAATPFLFDGGIGGGGFDGGLPEHGRA